MTIVQAIPSLILNHRQIRQLVYHLNRFVICLAKKHLQGNMPKPFQAQATALPLPLLPLPPMRLPLFLGWLSGLTFLPVLAAGHLAAYAHCRSGVIAPLP